MLTKTINIDIWEVGISNQSFTKEYYSEKKSRKKVVTDKTLFFMIGTFCTPYTICVKIGF